MNKKKLYESMMDNIANSLKSVLNEDTEVSKTPKLPPFTEENYPHLYKAMNEASQKEQLFQAKQFAYRVRNIADYIERDCKDYDERWALGYADQLRNAADKLLNMLK